jgi:polyferredoxin
MGIFTIAAGEDPGDLGAEFGGGFLRWRESDKEGEEARCKECSATCGWKKEKSPKEETS